MASVLGGLFVLQYQIFSRFRQTMGRVSRNSTALRQRDKHASVRDCR